MRLHNRLLAIPTVLAALAIAGCGGDDGEENAAAPARPEASPALGRAELLAQGDAICAEVNAAVGALASATSGARADQVADLYETMAERLGELRPPAAAARGYAEVVAAAEELARAEGHPALDGEAALADFRAAAEAYGFERCDEEPSAPAPAAGGEPAAPAEPAPAPAEEAAPEEAAPAPETGGTGAGPEEGGGAAAPGGETGGGPGSGGIGPG